MATTVNSFDRSDLGAFIRSPLGVRNGSQRFEIVFVHDIYESGANLLVAGSMESPFAQKPAGEYVASSGSLSWPIDSDIANAVHGRFTAGIGFGAYVTASTNHSWWACDGDFSPGVAGAGAFAGVDSSGETVAACLIEVEAPNFVPTECRKCVYDSANDLLIGIGRGLFSAVGRSCKASWDLSTVTGTAGAKPYNVYDNVYQDYPTAVLKGLCGPTGVWVVISDNSVIAYTRDSSVGWGASSWSWTATDGNVLYAVNDAGANTVVGGHWDGTTNNGGLWRLNSGGTEIAVAELDDIVPSPTGDVVVVSVCHSGGSTYIVGIADDWDSPGTTNTFKATSNGWLASVTESGGGFVVNWVKDLGLNIPFGLSARNGVIYYGVYPSDASERYTVLYRAAMADGAIEWSNGALV